MADQERTLGHERGRELAQPRDDRRVVAAVARDDVLAPACGGRGRGVVGRGLRRGHRRDGLGVVPAQRRGAAGRPRDQRHHAAVRVRAGVRVARLLLVDEQAALARHHLRVHDVDVEAALDGLGDGRHQALDERREQRFRARHLRDLAFVDQVEGVEVALRRLRRRREVLRVQRAHLLDQLDERLQRLVLCRKDDGRVDRAAWEIARQDLQHLLAHVDRDVFLRLDGRGAQVRCRDAFRVRDESCGWRVGNFRRWLAREDVDGCACDLAGLERRQQAFFVDDAASRDVEDAGAPLHLVEFRC